MFIKNYNFSLETPYQDLGMIYKTSPLTEVKVIPLTSAGEIREVV